MKYKVYLPHYCGYCNKEVEYVCSCPEHMPYALNWDESQKYMAAFRGALIAPYYSTKEQYGYR